MRVNTVSPGLIETPIYGKLGLSARLFNDGMVAFPTCRHYLWAFNFYHRLMKAYQFIGSTLKLPPKGGQLHMTLLQRPIRKEKLRHKRDRLPLAYLAYQGG